MNAKVGELSITTVSGHEKVSPVQNLADAIKVHLGLQADTETLDLRRIVAALQPSFPEVSPPNLALEVMKVATEQGFLYLVWMPPTAD